MALFKILKGSQSNLPTTETREGYVYFTSDENKFYIGKQDGEPPVPLNANHANSATHAASAGGLDNTLNVSGGGTGAITFTANKILCGNGASSIKTDVPEITAAGISISRATTGESKFLAENSSGGISLQASSNRGVYDEKAANKGWLIYTNADGSGAFIPKWKNTGADNTPIYIDSNGQARSVTLVNTANKLFTSLPNWTANPNDTTKLIRRDTAGAESFGQITFLSVFNYINEKTLANATNASNVPWSGVSGKPDTYTPASHTHGSITNDGKISSNVAIATGDRLIISDSSGSNVLKQVSIIFDGATATKALTQKGTWETFTNYSHPTTDAVNPAAVKIGKNTSGHVVIGSPLTYSDVSAASAGHTHDSTYLKLSGGTMTGKITLDGAPTNNLHAATKKYVDDTLATLNGAMIFKGTIGTGGTITALPATHTVGHTYRVITAGTYAGKKAEIGDLIICITNGTSANNDHWTIAQNNIDSGLYKSTNAFVSGNVLIADGTDGKVKDSGFTLNANVPSGAVFTDNDTKNTAGSTNNSSEKLFLIGANAQAASRQTYSSSAVYATAGTLTATAFSGNGVTLTDINASNIKTGTLPSARLATSGVTAGSYGTSSACSPSHGGTFKIPYITVDTYGRVNAASNITITLPQDNNTDINVTQSASSNGAIWRKVLLGHQGETTANASVNTITDSVYASQLIEANPGKGYLLSNGYYLTDNSGKQYLAIGENANHNLWIGGYSTNTANTTHHVGATYISSGFNKSTSNGYPTIYIAQPVNLSSNSSTEYPVWHDGYSNVSKVSSGVLPLSYGGTGATSAANAPWVQTSGDVMTGNLAVGNTSATTSYAVKVQNANGTIGLYSSINRGVWDFTNSRWLICTNSETDVRIPEPLVASGNIVTKQIASNTHLSLSASNTVTISADAGGSDQDEYGIYMESETKLYLEGENGILLKGQVILEGQTTWGTSAPSGTATNGALYFRVIS